MYNEIELENFNHENRVIHPMRFLNQTREYNHFSNHNWEIQLTKIVKCFKGNSIVWAEAHRVEWDNFETFERAFKGKFWPEEEQESLRSHIMGAGNFVGHNNITMYVTKLYNEAKYLEPPIPFKSFVRYVSKHLPREVQITLMTKEIENLSELERILDILQSIRDRETVRRPIPVSYTHLDVYKRQRFEWYRWFEVF